MISWRAYRPGDLALINRQEPEPFDGWAEFVEENGRAMATIERDGSPLAVIGCVPCWDGVAECFVVMDRERAAGAGKLLARMVRARILQGMPVLGLHRVQATAGAKDRPGQVFLRAVGFSREGVMRQGAPDRTDLIVYAFIGS